MRFRLRTLLIVLAVLPPLMALAWPIVRRTIWPPAPAELIHETIWDFSRSVPFGTEYDAGGSDLPGGTQDSN